MDTPEKYESGKLHRDAAQTGQDEKTIRALGERASDFTKSIVKRGAVRLDRLPASLLGGCEVRESATVRESAACAAASVSPSSCGVSASNNGEGEFRAYGRRQKGQRK